MEGRKTQTRRAVKPQFSVPAGINKITPHHLDNGRLGFFDEFDDFYCPYGQPGDRLWVRESWRGIVQINAPHDPYKTGVARYVPDQEHCKRVEYLATQKPDSEPWKPSIHMPRWASRITLEITGIRVERLQDISEEDAIAEGMASSFVRSGDTRVGGASKLYGIRRK